MHALRRVHLTSNRQCHNAVDFVDGFSLYSSLTLMTGENMNIQILLALLTLVTGGVTRFFWKFGSVNEAYGPSFLLLQSLGFCLVFGAAHFIQAQSFNLSPRMATFAILGGMFGGIGLLALYLAFDLGGQGSILFPIAALTMLVSVPLMFIVYREPVTATKLLGLGLGVSSIIVLTR